MAPMVDFGIPASRSSPGAFGGGGGAGPVSSSSSGHASSAAAAAAGIAAPGSPSAALPPSSAAFSSQHGLGAGPSTTRPLSDQIASNFPPRSTPSMVVVAPNGHAPAGMPDLHTTAASLGGGGDSGSPGRLLDRRPSVPRINTVRPPPPVEAASRNALFFSPTSARPPGSRHARHSSGSSQTFAASSSISGSIGGGGEGEAGPGSSFSMASLDDAANASTATDDAAFIDGGGGIGQGSSRSTYPADQSLATPACQLSSTSSIRSRRNWDEFEGKPVSPLPSPAVIADDDADPEAGKTSMFDRLLSAGAGGQSQFDSATNAASPSSSIVGSTSATSTVDPDTPSKTSAFFGASWSTYPRAPTTLPPPPSRRDRVVSSSDAADTGSDSNGATAASGSGGWSNLAPSLRAISADQTARGAAAAAVRRTGHGPSGRDGLDIEPGTSRAAAAVPAANAPRTSNSGPSDELSPLAAADEPRRRGGRFSRHTHGPSENASDGSLAPIIGTTGALAPDPSRTKDPSPSTPRPKSASSSSATTLTGATGATAAKERRNAEEVAEEDEEGDIVGPYRSEKVLGVGAFSKVVLGRAVRPRRGGSGGRSTTGAVVRNGTPPVDERVALKMLDREPCSQNERLKVSWVREVEVLKHISHPNLVRFVEAFSTPLHHTLVLEHVSGGELFELLAQHHERMAQREWLVRRIFCELANAVGWMHNVNLVHRDIKLENILLTTSLFQATDHARPGLLKPSQLPQGPLVKLTDFGLSRFIDPQQPSLETRCGSEEYAAPELIIGKRYDGRKTDAWALGVVLYAMLTGSLPFLDDLAMTARLLRRDATKRSSVWETWDAEWLLRGSFATGLGGESSAAGEQVELLPDPRSPPGRAWLAERAHIRGGQVSQVACDD
ncbi:uncharacterized protein PFL1_06946 [Pseudozyma flocculosa PF-1]|uniref:Protein kinase domain-containing protein n=1 Tax=Pseudozyma flocculosa PF-1 TaxID=1277687 RepID=A0A061H240_9BASI|nr:uncharacterized protein PFL1_06946 [Pseudozyma flocculosa PF-1]EPQ25850.1 hypothetical protein PFL1_06946 [Pseudozyma flocculosa PF-1]